MKIVLLWLGAVAVAAALLVAAGFRSSDPDSALYAKLAAALSTRPVDRWIAPEWGGEWNLQGPFREHPVGILLLPAAAMRLNVPPEQASYIVNMLYQVAVILLIPAVASYVVASYEARTLAWGLQLLPVAFAYRIRANQEHPLLMAFLAMLYATERARSNPAWTLLTVAAFCVFVLIKGAFAMFAFVAAALWLAIIPRTEGGSDRWAWIGLIGAVAASVLLVVGYEAIYVRTTGESFLEFYRSRRLGDSMSLFSAGVFQHSLVNVWFYIQRVLWFAAPWSLFAIAAFWALARSKVQGRAARALTWAGLIAAVYIVVLSPALVRAERFIFPVYFIIGAVGLVTALRRFDGFSQFAARADRYSWLPIAVWMITFLLSLGSKLI